MGEVLVLTERDLRGCVSLDAGTVDVVERAFRALADGGVVMPPRFDVMTTLFRS
jgi:ornithine cyclodeaminase